MVDEFGGWDLSNVTHGRFLQMLPLWSGSRGVALSFGADAPIHYYGIPAQQREQRTLLGSDQCVIDNEHYFVRGCLDIPIHDSAEVFRWGVWVSVSEQSFHRTSELWD